MRAGQRHLRRPQRPGVDHRDEELGRQRGPRAAERGVLERRVLRQLGLRGRQLHQRDQGLRQPAERQRHGGDPGPALDRRRRTPGPPPAARRPQATCQKPMPDAAQAIPFWTSVAHTFKGNDAVIFDLFNEPYASRATGSTTTGWQCWLNGGTCPGISYQVAGMQSMVNAVRSTGADQRAHAGRRGVLQRPHRRGWPTSRPTPTTTWSRPGTPTTSTPAPPSPAGPARSRRSPPQVPVVAGEIGENDCADGYVDPLMTWLDSQGISYLAWAWNADFACSSGPGLITDYTGTPTALRRGRRGSPAVPRRRLTTAGRGQRRAARDACSGAPRTARSRTSPGPRRGEFAARETATTMPLHRTRAAGPGPPDRAAGPAPTSPRICCATEQVGRPRSAAPETCTCGRGQCDCTDPPADTVSGARPPRPPGGSGLRFQLVSPAHARRTASEQGGSRPGPGPPGTALDPAPG